MPSAILESIMQNPLIMQPIENPAEELMNEEVQNRTRDILGKLDAMDKAKKWYCKRCYKFSTTYSRTNSSSGYEHGIFSYID